MAVVAVVILWVIWYFNSDLISNAIRWLRYGEMWLISFFAGNNYTVDFQGQALNWKQGFNATPTYKIGELNQGHLSLFAALAMQPLRPLFTLIFGAAALWIMFRGPGTQFRQKLDLEGLIKRQAGNFPIISPFIQFNPSNQPPRPPGSPVPAELPAFAEALGPEEWIAYNKIPIPDGVLNEKITARAFARQLGRRWQGVKALQGHEKILLAAFCLKASRKRNDADELLGRLALCWSQEKGLNLGNNSKVLKDAIRVLRTKSLAEKTLKECNNHAYTTTALLRALQFAREEGGVLAPAQFVWLRGHDRTLWYPLNNLGRHSFHMEAFGAMAHFKAERMTGRPIPRPKVQDAVDMIQNYMNSDRARPVPVLDYTTSTKRAIKKAV